MNNEIVNALEALATKLGTTSEYLWNILLRQAPITAVTDLIQYAFTVFVCILWIKKAKVFVAKISNDDWEEEHWIWIILISVILGIFAIAAFFSFPNTIYALVNPEYWALDRILFRLN
jgi:hypothetical protein